MSNPNQISGMTALGSLPASGGRVPVAKDGEAKNYNYDLAADLAGRPTNASLAADLALYSTVASLAATTGGSLVGAPDGTAISTNILHGRRITYGQRAPVTTVRQGRITANAIHTIVQGYAATQSITGGYGKQLFIVNTDGMDPTVGSYSSEIVNALPVGEGSYAWCLAQAAVAGGLIVFSSTRHFYLKITDNVQHRLDVGANDITVIAPGRNVTFEHKSLTGSTVIKGHNIIFAYCNFRTMPGPLSGDYDGSGNKVEVGLVSVFPQNIDKLAFVGCAFESPSDGALDIASTGFTTASTAAYVTIQDCYFRHADEVSLFGSISDTTVVTDTRKLFVSVIRPVYDGCGQRLPKALGLAMVDVVNPFHQMLPFRRDEPSPASEYGSCHGVSVQNGGWALVRGGLFTSLDGIAYEATKLVANPVSGETGRIRHVSNSGENGMTYAADSTSGQVPDPSYIGSVPTDPPPAVGASREAWIAARWLAVGPGADAAPTGLFTWDSASSEYPNQTTVVRRRVNGSYISGREICVEPGPGALDTGPTDSDTIDAIPRGYTRTVGFTEGKATKAAIGATFLDLANADSSFFLVQGNGAAVTVKHVIRSDDVAIDDGTVLHLFGSSSAAPTFVTATSATVTATAATDTISHTSHGETASGFRVVLSNSGGGLPASLVANTVYYGIYVDANSYKLATSYSLAVAGTAIDITSAGTGTHTAVLGSFNLPNTLPIILDSTAKGQQFRLNSSNWRFTAFGAAHQLQTTVALLPAAGNSGRRAFVTDANATTFASTVAGGGANRVPVYDNGTNWVIG